LKRYVFVVVTLFALLTQISASGYSKGIEITLKRDGWNLVAVCQDINASSIDMTNIKEIQDQNGNSIYTGEYAQYSNLKVLKAGYGYWVKSNKGVKFKVGQSTKKLSIPFKRDGWNLMAMCEDRQKSLLDMTNITEIQDQSGNSIYTGIYAEFSNLNILSAGYGYWVKASKGGFFIAKDFGGSSDDDNGSSNGNDDNSSYNNSTDTLVITKANENISVDLSKIKTIKCPSLSVGDKFKINQIEYEVVDNNSLKALDREDYEHICISHVTDMSNLFYNNSAFNQDIGKWDTSNVTNMNGMFYNAVNFNQPINNWDISKVTDMRDMFYNAFSFNQPINWDMSHVKYKDDTNRKIEIITLDLNNTLSGENIAQNSGKLYSFELIENATVKIIIKANQKVLTCLKDSNNIKIEAYPNYDKKANSFTIIKNLSKGKYRLYIQGENHKAVTDMSIKLDTYSLQNVPIQFYFNTNNIIFVGSTIEPHINASLSDGSWSDTLEGITITSSDNSILEIKNGKFIAKKAGKVKVTLSSPLMSQSYEINVIDLSSLESVENKTYTIPALGVKVLKVDPTKVKSINIKLKLPKDSSKNDLLIADLNKTGELTHAYPTYLYSYGIYQRLTVNRKISADTYYIVIQSHSDTAVNVELTKNSSDNNKYDYIYIDYKTDSNFNVVGSKTHFDVKGVIDHEDSKVSSDEIIWSVNDTSIATIDSDGILTGKKQGVVIINAQVGNLVTNTLYYILNPQNTIELQPTKTYPYKLGNAIYGQKINLKSDMSVNIDITNLNYGNLQIQLIDSQGNNLINDFENAKYLSCHTISTNLKQGEYYLLLFYNNIKEKIDGIDNAFTVKTVLKPHIKTEYAISVQPNRELETNELVKFKLRKVKGQEEFEYVEWYVDGNYVESSSGRNAFTYSFNRGGNYTVKAKLHLTSGETLVLIKNIKVKEDTVDRTPPAEPEFTTKPETELIGSSKTVEIKGEVGSKVFVNNEYVATIGESGKVSIELSLGEEKEKTFSIKLQDKSQNESSPLEITLKRVSLQKAVGLPPLPPVEEFAQIKQKLEKQMESTSANSNKQLNNISLDNLIPSGAKWQFITNTTESDIADFSKYKNFIMILRYKDNKWYAKGGNSAISSLLAQTSLATLNKLKANESIWILSTEKYNTIPKISGSMPEIDSIPKGWSMMGTSGEMTALSYYNNPKEVYVYRDNNWTIDPIIINVGEPFFVYNPDLTYTKVSADAHRSHRKFVEAVIYKTSDTKVEKDKDSITVYVTDVDTSKQLGQTLFIDNYFEGIIYEAKKENDRVIYKVAQPNTSFDTVFEYNETIPNADINITNFISSYKEDGIELKVNNANMTIGLKDLNYYTNWNPIEIKYRGGITTLLTIENLNININKKIDKEYTHIFNTKAFNVRGYKIQITPALIITSKNGEKGTLSCKNSAYQSAIAYNTSLRDNIANYKQFADYDLESTNDSTHNYNLTISFKIDIYKQAEATNLAVKILSSSVYYNVLKNFDYKVPSTLIDTKLYPTTLAKIVKKHYDFFSYVNDDGTIQHSTIAQRRLARQISNEAEVCSVGLGKISVGEGDITIIRDGEEIPYTQGMQIYATDTIQTGNTGVVQIALYDSTVITLGRNANFNFNGSNYKNAQPKVQFKILRGAFKFISGRIGKIARRNFKIKTSNATIGIRG